LHVFKENNFKTLHWDGRETVSLSTNKNNGHSSSLGFSEFTFVSLLCKFEVSNLI